MILTNKDSGNLMSLAIDVLMSILTSGTTTAILVTIINKKLDENSRILNLETKKQKKKQNSLETYWHR